MDFNKNKSENYYRFIAPARLASKGIAITKENIQEEIRRLKENITENNVNKANKASIIANGVIDFNSSTIDIEAVNELEINVVNNEYTVLYISKLNAPNLERLIAPQVELYIDKSNIQIKYDKIKYIDIMNLTSEYNNGLVDGGLLGLRTLIIRGSYINSGLNDFLRNSPIVNRRGHIYVRDELLQLYKQYYSGNPSIQSQLKSILELKQ